MEIRNKDGSTKTQTRDNTEKVVFHIGSAGRRTRDLRDTMKASKQATRLHLVNY